jgi:hypothetical protein
MSTPILNEFAADGSIWIFLYGMPSIKLETSKLNHQLELADWGIGLEGY